MKDLKIHISLPDSDAFEQKLSRPWNLIIIYACRFSKLALMCKMSMTLVSHLVYGELTPF